VLKNGRRVNIFLQEGLDFQDPELIIFPFHVERREGSGPVTARQPADKKVPNPAHKGNMRSLLSIDAASPCERLFFLPLQRLSAFLAREGCVARTHATRAAGS